MIETGSRGDTEDAEKGITEWMCSASPRDTHNETSERVDV